MKQSKILLGVGTLGVGALLLAWSWRFASPHPPVEPLSKSHFQKHRTQLEALRVLVKEDAREMGRDIIVSHTFAQTENKLPLPQERAELYRASLRDANLEVISCSERGNRVWIHGFDQKAEYAYFLNGPTRYDYQHGNCEFLQGRWYLYSPR